MNREIDYFYSIIFLTICWFYLWFMKLIIISNWILLSNIDIGYDPYLVAWLVGRRSCSGRYRCQYWLRCRSVNPINKTHSYTTTVFFPLSNSISTSRNPRRFDDIFWFYGNISVKCKERQNVNQCNKLTEWLKVIFLTRY